MWFIGGVTTLVYLKTYGGQPILIGSILVHASIRGHLEARSVYMQLTLYIQSAVTFRKFQDWWVIRVSGWDDIDLLTWLLLWLSHGSEFRKELNFLENFFSSLEFDSKRRNICRLYHRHLATTSADHPVLQLLIACELQPAVAVAWLLLATAAYLIVLDIIEIFFGQFIIFDRDRLHVFHYQTF